MRLYLGLDNITALSNEIAKVEIHYALHYDLIKPHKIILIFFSNKELLNIWPFPVSLHEVSSVTSKLFLL